MRGGSIRTETIGGKKIKGLACIASTMGKGRCQIIFVVDKKDAVKVVRALKR